MGRKARFKRERRLGRSLGAEPESERELRRQLADTGIPTAEGPLPGDVKISTALLEIVQPFIDAFEPEDRTIGRIDVLLRIAQLAWNGDLLPNADEALENSVRLLDQLGFPRDLSHELLSRMIDRRRQLFPGDRRFITHLVVRPGRAPGQFDVSAACGLLTVTPRAAS